MTLLKERQAQKAREEAAKAAEESQRVEQARQELEEKREQYIRHLCSTLAEEPNDTYTGQVTKINFRLADGTRVVRKFRGEDTIEVKLSTCVPERGLWINKVPDL